MGPKQKGQFINDVTQLGVRNLHFCDTMYESLSKTANIFWHVDMAISIPLPTSLGKFVCTNKCPSKKLTKLAEECLIVPWHICTSH